MTRKRKHKNKQDYKKYLEFCKARNQAKFRNEGWMITEEEYYKIWRPDLYKRKGRGLKDLCLTRLDDREPWSWNNVCVISREIHFKLKVKRYKNLPFENFFQQAEWLP